VYCDVRFGSVMALLPVERQTGSLKAHQSNQLRTSSSSEPAPGSCWWKRGDHSLTHSLGTDNVIAEAVRLM